MFFHKHQCENCGALYDVARDSCPKCHQKNPNERSLKAFEHLIPLGPNKEIIIFLIGFLGFQILALIFQSILLFIGRIALSSGGLSGASLNVGLEAFAQSGEFLAFLNYGSYFVTLLLLLFAINNDFLRLVHTFKNKKTYWGILGGLLLLGISLLFSYLLSLGGYTSSDNQEAADKILESSLVLGFLMSGFIIPFIEEVTYRLALFNLTRRINVVVAYIASTLIFALLHLHDFTSISEWAAFPVYLLGGFAFSFLYHRFGFGAAYLGHVIYNLSALIINVAL